MIERRAVPEDLAELPPGPRLAAVLATFDRSLLNGHDLVTLMRARARQVAHDQAQLLADMFEVAHCPPGDANAAVIRTSHIDEFTADEIRMPLTLTRRAADAALSLAVDVVDRLPKVHAALLEGEIDLPKTRVLSQETGCLPETTARAVVDQILPTAPTLTTGQLAARIRALAIITDPDAATRRQERSVGERRVVTELDPDGTATLAGYRLPADRAAVAAARIDALARTARRTGDARSMDQLRADTFLDLLEGTGAGATAVGTVSADMADADACAAGGGRTGGQGVVELRVPLTTLVGLSEQPGELAGWGPVVAEIARNVANRNQRSVWRVSVYDDHGRLVHHGPVRRRPTIRDAEFVKARDRTCRAPGCRAPASRSDIDHTQPYARGGPTRPDNLGLLCRHDHRLKDQGGWGLRQIHNGVFVWRSRLGHQYAVPPDPPLPP